MVSQRSMKRVLLLCFLAACPMIDAGPAHARNAPVTSWGRPDVGLQEYRDDAAACNLTGGLRDIRDLEPTKRFVQGFELRERNLNTASAAGQLDERRLVDEQNRIRRLYDPNRQIDQVADAQLSTTEACLATKGYRRFQLTKAQAKLLARHPKGTPERRAYLHQLASDGGILAAQAVP